MPLVEEYHEAKAKIPKVFKRDVTELVEAAIMCGWKLHITSDQSMTIIAPDETHKHHFTARRQTKNLQQVRRSIVRWGDAVKVATVKTMDSVPDSMLSSLPMIHDKGVMEVTMPENEEPKPIHVPTPSEVFSTEPEVDAHVDPAPAFIVSERAMVAKAGDNQGYLSETTTERRWSDGTIDYACRFPDCDFTSTNRKSPSAHYATVHRHGKGTAPIPERFEATVTPHHYSPRQDRVESLADVIRGYLAGGAEPEDIARAALTWVHDQTRKGTDLAAEVEPMSDSDLVHRIRLLLDQGEFRQMQNQITDLEERLVRAEQEATTCKAQAEAANTRAHRAYETLHALTELAREASSEEETSG